MKHTFSILAYKESPHLEDCLRSIVSQNSPSHAIICTSTPNTHIEGLAKKYNLEVAVNTEAKGIAADWNFALKQAKTPYVTLAHQDDSYDKDFLNHLLAAALKYPDSGIIFSDYREQKGESFFENTTNLRIKRYLLSIYFTGCQSIKSKWRKHASLLLGSPICCPAIMYNLEKLPAFKFNVDFKVSLDWEAWLRIAHQDAAFTWVRKILMTHRIHEQSATTSGVIDGDRQKEDRIIFNQLWPWPLNRILSRFYEISLKGNN